MKQSKNEKIAKLTRQGLAFLLAMVLMTSAFVPGLTARAVEDTTDPSVMVLGETQNEETENSAEESTEVSEELPVDESTEVPEELPAGEPAEVPEETLTENATEESTEVPEEETTISTEVAEDILPQVVKPVIGTLVSSNNAGANRAAGAEGLILSKTTEPRGDGTYDLELTLKGSVGEEFTNQQIDVAIVIDRSASMENENRLATAKAAANNLINILEANDAVSAMYNIIDFGGSANTKNSDLIAGSTYGEPVAGASGWVAGSTAKSKVGQIDIHGADKFTSYAGYNNQNATNYEAAIQVLNAQMSGTRSGAMTAIIFLTDGKPTCAWTTIDPNHTYLRERPDAAGYYYFPADYAFYGNNYIKATDWYGFGTSYEGPNNTQLCLNVAMDDAANMKADMLFLLGTGTADLNMLRQLETAAVNGGKVGTHEAELVASSDIAEKFAAIAQKLSKHFYTQVTVTDILRHSSGELVVDLIDNAEILVSVYDGDTKIAGPATEVTLLATDNNGEAKVSTAFNAATRQLDMIFPASYKLEPNYTYKMSTIIRPTEKAYEMYRDGGYQHEGDPETGSLSGKDGFFANDSATAYYNYSGIAGQNKPYAKPIVQLTPGQLKVIKKFEGIEDLTQEQIDSLLEKTSFYVKLTYPLDPSLDREEAKSDEFTFNLTDAKVVRTGDTFTWTVDKLSPNTVYTVTETGGELEDYDQTTSWTAPCEASCAENCAQHKGVVKAEETTAKTVSGVVDKGETVTVSYTNAYTVSSVAVSVEKQTVGNLGDWNKPFQFTASINNGTMNGIRYIKYNADGQAAGEQATISGESFSFTLKDDEYIMFVNIPLKSTFTISENPEDYELIEVKATESKDLTRDGNAAVLNVTAENKVTFTNELEASIETGVVLDSMPYVLMLGAVAVCAFFFLRKRRVEE